MLLLQGSSQRYESLRTSAPARGIVFLLQVPVQCGEIKGCPLFLGF